MCNSRMFKCGADLFTSVHRGLDVISTNSVSKHTTTGVDAIGVCRCGYLLGYARELRSGGRLIGGERAPMLF